MELGTQTQKALQDGDVEQLSQCVGALRVMNQINLFVTIYAAHVVRECQSCSVAQLQQVIKGE